MPRRIILHAGFHKTGTTTIQATLRENRAAIKRQVALRLRWHMKDIISASRGYSTDEDPLTLIKVQTRFGHLMNELPGMPRRTLIVSAEELSGHLPGRGNLTDYSAAPVLLYSYWEIAKARYPQAEILVYLSTRNAEDWTASAHWEHVKSSNMTMSLAEFQDRYAKAGDLSAMVSEVASRVPAPVHAHALEDCSALPLGPADPLLDLCDIPDNIRQTLTPVPRANERFGPDVLEAMIAANRENATPMARNAAKALILAEAAAK